MKKNIAEVGQFKKSNPAQPEQERETHECHCGNAYVTEIVKGKRAIVFGIDCFHEPRGLITILPAQKN